MIRIPLSAILCSTLLTGQGQVEKATADLVLRNGKIVTVDPDLGTVDALAIRGDRILAAGTDSEVARYIVDSTKILDLNGKMAMPGFIEGHGHFTGVGDAMQRLDLMHVKNWQEVVAMVAAAVAQARPGEWILGRGWHQEKWDRVPPGGVEGFPAHDTLSAVSPNNPVMLTHASGHASFFNAKAMDLAGVDSKTKDPKGGEILRDEGGRPIGVFRENATGLVSRARRSGNIRRSRADVRAALRQTIKLADDACLSNGVTSFQDAGSGFGTIDMFREMVDKGELHTRLWVMIRSSNRLLASKMADYRMIGHGNNHLTVRAVKRSIDGALGPRGAWLLEPYDDLKSSRGLETSTVKNVTEMARLAMKHDFQACVHAIGDRANREVLDIFEKQFRANPAKKDLRWRIEHAQHIHPDDVPRFGKLGIIASMQGVHCTSDAIYVLARLGEERARTGAYVWQDLMQTGALVTNGTDAPVENISPIASFYSTVSRRLKDGSVFFHKQRMSRMEALRSYTVHAAKAAFEEDIKGTLTPGKLADVVVLSRNLMTCAEKDIPTTKVLYTILGGKVRYQAK
ncbi:MAG: amidohydrolase [Planctomycetota bacterium]|nr:amidohydrolase [Planctomycetota bacterium]